MAHSEETKRKISNAMKFYWLLRKNAAFLKRIKNVNVFAANKKR
ncbi:hypothetical protein G6L37_11845 [Agrobacterium rubi]|uniref:Uncharacterized protein n=1 Tax=Agrobacterium rosae TaxID=1972867 RepID=A0A1R3TRJ1_9HYPH|nr:hypothetical protein [Agrobacterium rubi]NTF19096.1 hypothetical protein [Agrobacterium rubi]NTF26059.1 hypothetical protein [Agrobacterium rubi]SCX19562.1 hypothetical protein DSM25559_1861 [Agrobacterium rosae]